SVRCGHATFDITGRRTAAFDGTHVRARESILEYLDRAHVRRLIYSWNVAGTIAGPQANGTLHVIAVLRRRARPGQSCARSPDRPWSARLVTAVAGPPAPPAPGATLLGGSGEAIVDGLPGSMIVRVTHDGRASALWTAVAGCGHGRRELFANYTP